MRYLHLTGRGVLEGAPPSREEVQAVGRLCSPLAYSRRQQLDRLPIWRPAAKGPAEVGRVRILPDPEKRKEKLAQGRVGQLATADRAPGLIVGSMCSRNSSRRRVLPTPAGAMTVIRAAGRLSLKARWVALRS